MRARTWFVTGLVAAVAGTAVGLILVSPSILVAAPPNADLVPATVVAYAEVNGLGPVWGSVTGTESWRDLEASTILAEILGTPTGKAALDLAERVETKGGYALDAARTMHFVGRQVSFGLDAIPATGDPAWLALTKLDVDALVGEMLRGERDRHGLHAELDRRASAMEFQVERSSHGGRDISSATRGKVAFHATLLGDTLAVSDSIDLLRRTIDVHAAGGSGSLGRTPRFRDEVAKLPKGSLAYDWIDLTALRASKASLSRWLNEHEKSGALAGAAERILEGTPGAPALARSMELPGGDLYRVRWAHSRTGSELAGAAAPADLTAVVGGHPITAEVRDIGSIATAWEKSSLRRKLGAGPIGDQFREWTDDLAKFEETVRESPLGGLAGGGAMPFGEEDDTDSGTPGAARRKTLLGMADRFTVKMALHVARESLTQSFSGNAAIGAGPAEGHAPASSTVAIGLGAQGHLFALAAEGAALAADGDVRRSERGGVAVFSIARGDDSEPSAHWAHVGDALVCATGLDLLDRALEAATHPAAVAPPAGAPMQLEPGWCVRVRIDGKAIVAWTEKSQGAEDARMLSATFPEEFVGGLYLAPDLAWAECRTLARYGRDILPADASGDPRTLQWIPGSTVLVGGVSTDLKKMLEEARRVFPAEFGTQLDEGLGEARKEIGVDIEKELLPALGPEIAFAIVHAAAPSKGPPGWDDSNGPAPFLPGMVLSFEVRDEVFTQRAVDGTIAAIRRSLEQDGMSADQMPFQVAEELVDGSRVLRFVPRDPQTPSVEPTVAIGKGRLLIGLDSGVVRACLDAAAGRAPSLAASPVRARMRERLPDAGGAWGLLDWNRAADQVAEYAPLIARSFPTDRLPDGRTAPEPPVRPGRSAWQKYERELKSFQDEAQKSRVPEVRKWIDAFRVIDHMAAAGTNRGPMEERRFVVKFAE